MQALAPLLLALSMACASAPRYETVRPRAWELLGSRRVSFAAERDVIAVGGNEGRFRRVRIDVDRGNVDLYEVRIVFRNGDVFAPRTRFEFREGSRSRVIDLPGDARVIRRVEFVYRSEVRRGRATVSLLGI